MEGQKERNIPVSSFQTTASSVNLPRLWYALGTSPADQLASEVGLTRSSIRASRGLTLQLIARDVELLEAGKVAQRFRQPACTDPRTQSHTSVRR